MHNEQYFCDRVAAGRRSIGMGVRTAGGASLTEEVVGLALVDIVALVMVVRIVNRQVQLNNRIATGSHRSQRIYVYTALPQLRAVEIERQVVLTDLLRDDLMRSRLHRDRRDIDTVIVIVGARGEDVSAALSDVVAVLPGVRRLALADSYLFDELIGVMYEEVQTINAIACVFRLETIAVFIGRVEAVHTDRVTVVVAVDPNIRGIYIGDMYRQLVVVARMNGEVQHVDMIATMLVDRRIIMVTCGAYKAWCECRLVHAPTHRVTFADGSIDGVVGLFPNVDVYVVYTVVTIDGLATILIVTGDGDIVQTAPCVRCFLFADIDRIIRNTVGRMDVKRQAVYTVTTVDVRQYPTVTSGDIERIVLCLQLSVLPPGMGPDVRGIHIGDVRTTDCQREARPNLQVQRDDAIATVKGRNGVVVDTGLFIEPFGQRGRQIGVYLCGVTGTYRIIDMRLIGAVEIHEQHIDAIEFDTRLQGICILDGVICQRGGVLLYITRGPGMLQGLVDLIAYIDRIAEDVGLMHDEVQAVHAVATVDTRHDEDIVTAGAEGVGRVLR